jgi:hypothetical protein
MNPGRTPMVIIFLLFFFLIAHYSMNYTQNTTPIENSVHLNVANEGRHMLSDQVIPEPLLKILAITGIEHDGTLSGIVAQTQKNLLRKDGTERWQIGNQFELLHDQLEPLLQELGFINAVIPTHKEYDYVLVLGSLAPSFRTRLAHLLKLYEKGIRFKKLVIQTGERPLDAVQESKDLLFDRNNIELPIRSDWQESVDLPKTEVDMVNMVLDQAQFPDGFKDMVTIEVISAPMQHVNGSIRRPNTGDVIKLWLSKKEVQPGAILAISNQPYVLYQHAVLKTLLPDTFNIETVGSAAARPLHIGIILDSLARWLYQEHMYNQSKKS